MSAADLWEAGLTALPVRADGSKAPVGRWAQVSRAAQGADDVVRIDEGVAAGRLGVGVRTGTDHGGLDMWECEGRSAMTAGGVREAMGAAGLSAVWSRVEAGWVERSPSGGIHWFVRISDGAVPGNERVAVDPGTGACLVETRGSGGFVVIAPSSGRVHPSGSPWEVISGRTGQAALVTLAERSACLDVLARLSGGALPARPVRVDRPDGPRLVTGDRPGDVFEAEADWSTLLTERGWSPHSTHADGQQWWTRPGKEARDGHSATLGRPGVEADRLWVFSASAGLPTDEPLSRFAFVTHSDFGGDFSAAASSLRSRRPASAGMVTSGALALVPDVLSAEPDDEAHYPWAVGLADGPRTELAVRAATEWVARGSYCRLRSARRGEWLAWDASGVWRQAIDCSGSIMEAVVAALPRSDDIDAKFAAKWANRPLQIMSFAGSHQGLVVDDEDMVVGGEQLPVPGGWVDLSPGGHPVEPASPELRNMERCSVAPSPSGAPLWEGFLEQTFPDPAIRDYFHRLAGMSLLGAGKDPVLVICHGSGANGKSVAMDVLTRVLGGMAGSATTSLITGASSYELASAARWRLALMSESGDNVRINDEGLKRMLSSEPMMARQIYGAPFQFVPRFTLWLTTNTIPDLTDGGESMRRRIRLVPFSHTVPEGQRDTTLPDRIFAAEGGGVLSWLLAGLDRYRESGSGEPEMGGEETIENYLEDQDSVGRWIAERVTPCHGTDLSCPDVVGACQDWLTQHRLPTRSARHIMRRLREAGYTIGRSHGRYRLLGAAVAPLMLRTDNQWQ